MIGLTTHGAIDAAFGSGGSAPADAAAPAAARCLAMTLQPDDKILLGGQTDEHGLLRRLLATGAADATLSGEDVADRMSMATALGVGTGGAVLVAGLSHDEFAGHAGRALVAEWRFRLRATALPARRRVASDAELQLLRLPAHRERLQGSLLEGRVLLAGGGNANFWSQGFMARLVGDGGSGPGVLNVKDCVGRGDRGSGRSPRGRTTCRRWQRGGQCGLRGRGRGLRPSTLTAAPGSDFTATAGPARLGERRQERPGNRGADPRQYFAAGGRGIPGSPADRSRGRRRTRANREPNSDPR